MSCPIKKNGTKEFFKKYIFSLLLSNTRNNRAKKKALTIKTISYKSDQSKILIKPPY